MVSLKCAVLSILYKDLLHNQSTRLLNLFNEIEKLIDELIETIGKIRQNRETNASAVKEQKILVENEIRELRRKIDKLNY
jgi:predicted  nucleic acid-binding Zn-ribbon protein